MMSLSAAILVATCTATFGLHSSSSTTISYSYFAFGSALRRRTARSAELRPPRPLTETPPVSGPINPTLTLSLASAVAAAKLNAMAAIAAAVRYIVVIRPPLVIVFAQWFLAVQSRVARWENDGKPYLCRAKLGRVSRTVRRGYKKGRPWGRPFASCRSVLAVVLRQLLPDPVEPCFLLTRQRCVEALE